MEKEKQQITCSECGAKLDTLHEETGQYGVYEWSESNKKYEHTSDELPDYSVFYCPNCHAEINAEEATI
jgi:predicted RNA-binding Zn-ribbon protein involved in translation (DUF1610 family)